MDAGHGAAGETDLRGSEVGSRVESTDALDRLIFFADAVFAIAMTLLVLAIPRPENGTDVRSFLEHQD
ncbi:MAG TPA: TMEM175 family protein, partial [Actinomycetota bacterium]